MVGAAPGKTDRGIESLNLESKAMDARWCPEALNRWVRLPRHYGVTNAWELKPGHGERVFHCPFAQNGCSLFV